MDSTRAIEEALGALGANFSVDFRRGFHALRSLMPANHSTEGWVNNWQNRAGTEVVSHQLASMTSASSFGGEHATTSIGDIPLLLESGALVRAFSCEEDKYSLVSRLSRWLALSAMWHFYHWMVSETGCAALSKNIYSVVSSCPRTPCKCHRLYYPFNLLCELAHHVQDYLASNPRDTSTSVPYDLASRLISDFRLPPNSIIRTDLRTSIPKKGPEQRRLKRVEEEFNTVFRLLLEQIFVYPHVRRLLAHEGVTFGSGTQSNYCLSSEEFKQLRECTIAVGGICSGLQRAFGTTIIFSFTCNEEWSKIIHDPGRYFFMGQGKQNRILETRSVARELERGELTYMRPVMEYIDEVLQEKMVGSKSKSTSRPSVSAHAFYPCSADVTVLMGRCRLDVAGGLAIRGRERLLRYVKLALLSVRLRSDLSI